MTMCSYDSFKSDLASGQIAYDRLNNCYVRVVHKYDADYQVDYLAKVQSYHLSVSDLRPLKEGEKPTNLLPPPRKNERDMMNLQEWTDALIKNYLESFLKNYDFGPLIKKYLNNKEELL